MNIKHLAAAFAGAALFSTAVSAHGIHIGSGSYYEPAPIVSPGYWGDCGGIAPWVPAQPCGGVIDTYPILPAPITSPCPWSDPVWSYPVTGYPVIGHPVVEEKHCGCDKDEHDH